MDIIEEIYQKSIQPNAHAMSSDRAYRNAKNGLKQDYQRLCDRLTEEETGILNKLMSRYETVIERKKCILFYDRV